MSNASIAAEVHKIEETVKEELVKASMHLRGEFQQQLNMERQDRQVMLAEIRRDIEQQRTTILTVTEKVGAFSNSDQISEQQEAFRKLESQQHTMEKIFQDNELFALKMSAAETTIAELQKAMAGYATILENVKLEAARQSAVHADIIQQHMEVGIHNDQVQELRRECNSQRLQLVEQSSKFTATAAENETFRLKLAALESSLEDVQSAGGAAGARSPQDLSMQSELHSHVVALKETVAQLRSDVAVQSTMNTDYLVQQAGLESLRKEVSKLKLCTTPAAVTMNVNLEESIQKLRADMEKKFTYLEQQAHIGIASTIADTLTKRFADILHKDERKDKLVEGGQPANLAGAEGNQDMQESKERDLGYNNFVAAGEWSAAKEAALEEMSKHGSDASSSIHPMQVPEGISSDPESVWMSADLKNTLTSLVDRIQSNLKMSTTGPESVNAQVSGGTSQSRGSSPLFPRRKADTSPRYPNQVLTQSSPSVPLDMDRRPGSSPIRNPSSMPPGRDTLSASRQPVDRREATSVSVPAMATGSMANRTASLPERTVPEGGIRTDSSGSCLLPVSAGSPSRPPPNRDMGRTNQFATRKASQSPTGMSRSRAYGSGEGQHTLGSEGGGYLNKARTVSPVSAGVGPGSGARQTSAQGPAASPNSSVFRNSSNVPTSPESATASLMGGLPVHRGMSTPQQRSAGPGGLRIASRAPSQPQAPIQGSERKLLI